MSRRLKSFFRDHGYEVQSGPWPFYRLVAANLFIGSLIQLGYGAPPSVAEGLYHWQQITYLIVMVFCTGLVLLSAQFMRLSLTTLYLERLGITLLGGTQFIYMLNYFIVLGVPKTPQTWILIAIFEYSIFRFFQLSKEIKRTLKELGGE